MSSSDQQSPVTVQNVSALLNVALKSVYKARDPDSEVGSKAATPPLILLSILIKSTELDESTNAKHIDGISKHWLLPYIGRSLDF